MQHSIFHVFIILKTHTECCQQYKYKHLRYHRQMVTHLTVFFSGQLGKPAPARFNQSGF